MLTRGERMFRKGLFIVIGLLIGTTAVLVVIEHNRGPRSETISSVNN